MKMLVIFMSTCFLLICCGEIVEPNGANKELASTVWQSNISAYGGQKMYLTFDSKGFNGHFFLLLPIAECFEDTGSLRVNFSQILFENRPLSYQLTENDLFIQFPITNPNNPDSITGYSDELFKRISLDSIVLSNCDTVIIRG